MKILVIEDDADLRDVIGFYIESEVGTEVVYADSVREAKQMLSLSMDYSAIICDYTLGDGTAEEICRTLAEGGNSIPFVLCSSHGAGDLPFFKDSKISGFVLKSEIFEKLKSTLENIFAHNPSPPSVGLADTEYCRIRTQTVLKLGMLNCDLYIRLPQTKYIRVLRQGDLIESADLTRFDKKSVVYLYVKNEDRMAMLKKLARDLLGMSDADATSVETVYQISTSTLEMIGDMTKCYGFDAEVQEVTKASVALTVKNIQSSDVLGDLFRKLMIDPDRYLPSHSVALSYLCCGIASLMGWKSDTTFYKLTLASFLHDILLSSNELAEIQTLVEMNQQLEGRPEEIKEYLQHPQECAKLLNHLKEIPLDVDIIIAQHHERPDGSGFPGHINYSKISPLSALFILAHELLRYQYDSLSESASDEGVARFLKELPDEYHHGYFKNVTKVVIDSVTQYR